MKSILTTIIISVALLSLSGCVDDYRAHPYHRSADYNRRSDYYDHRSDYHDHHNEDYRRADYGDPNIRYRGDRYDGDQRGHTDVNVRF